MLDLSNNNAVGHNFHAAYVRGGQRRLYLKAVQGTHFVDETYPALRTAALAAGFQVGAYAFLEPLKATPGEAARYLLSHIKLPLTPGKDLRPALDCEYGAATPAAGKWIAQVAGLVRESIGVKPLIYGSGYWLAACKFPAAPGPLWLAAYGRNDGTLYPVKMIPKPWTALAAHQYTSTATVVGINGPCDLSIVAAGGSIDLPAAPPPPCV